VSRAASTVSMSLIRSSRSVPPMEEIPQSTSIYSHQDGRLRINVNVQDQSHAGDISPLTPLSSQKPRSRHGQNEQPVSPIEPTVPAYARGPLPERPSQTQLPRQLKPDGNNWTAQTKWDGYSGEPTDDTRGAHASVRPGTQPVEMQYPHLKERTKQILAGIREREAAKKKPSTKVPPPVADDPLDHPPQRPPWKGASGREALVEPVKNTPSARLGPLQVPERKASRHPEHSNSATNTFHNAVTKDPVLEDSPAVRSRLREAESQESIRPLVPLKTRNLSPSLTSKTPLQSPTKQTAPESPEEPASQQSSISEPAHARVESPLYEEGPRTPITPPATMELSMHNSTYTAPSFVPPVLDREQSHFSWATYTTTAAESPHSMAQIVRDSSPPPLPDLAPPLAIKKRPLMSGVSMHPQPYMHRQCADSTGSVISTVTRKPVPSVQPRNSSLSTATARVMSTSKSLPPTPTVAEAADKMETLTAQLECLNRRRYNGGRIVGALEAVLKKNALVYDATKRKEVERNIANHNMELEDVRRQIHEISLQLHRAQRKRDREEGYEACTGLWVKRVTS